MQNKANITQGYSRTAIKYADKFSNELAEKRFDHCYLRDFARRNQQKGTIADIGCGPGHVTNFLYESGCTDIVGVDLSPGMVEVARQRYPGIPFRQGDMLEMPFQDGALGGAVALYSIIHFDYDTIKKAFLAINAALADNSEFLFSFHIGDEVLNVKDFLGEEVDMNFHFLNVSRITEIIHETGFTILDLIERHPYPAIEYQSKRAYVLAGKNRM